jgi:hypothetical protein
MGLEEIDSWLEGVRQYWTDRLAGLERELAKPEKKRRIRRKS